MTDREIASTGWHQTDVVNATLCEKQDIFSLIKLQLPHYQLVNAIGQTASSAKGNVFLLSDSPHVTH